MPTHATITGFFEKTGLALPEMLMGNIPVHSPVTGHEIARLNWHATVDVANIIDRAATDFGGWREVPMPVRGRLVGIFGEVLREYKVDLAAIVTLEAGKIRSESLGEVQEMIDVAEYAVGLSRQIGGAIIPSELNNHVLQERWHPKGVVGIISAFNFPVAVWAWNLALSVVCGNTNIWKPSEKTLVCAMAAHGLWDIAVRRFTSETGQSVPQGVSQLILGGAETGVALVADPRVALVSATGSSRMGEQVQGEVVKTLGRTCLLELGGNNAVVLTPSAPMPLALQSTLFGAIGTAGQRCTTTRRLFVHDSIFDRVWTQLHRAYGGLDAIIGDPEDDRTLVGPLIDKAAYRAMQQALRTALEQGGEVTGGHRVHEGVYPDAYYVRPAIVKMPGQTPIVAEEVFAPILYVMRYDDLDEAILLNNAVTQGLSAAIFTRDITEAERFMRDADTGIVNVNNGTSGAEIGGAFGGNKSTGGGRESGSDAWKQYMTRSTNRLNFQPKALQLAQGVKFNIEFEGDLSL